MKKIILIGLIVLILISVYYLKEEMRKPSYENCDCIPDSIKCEYYTSKYLEWYCIKNNTGCGFWRTNYKWCNLGDLKVSHFSFSPISPIEGESINLTVMFGVENPHLIKDFDISVYTTLSEMDGNVYTELIDKRTIKANQTFDFINLLYRIKKVGNYNFTMILDEENKVKEANEFNNIYSYSIESKPDIPTTNEILDILNEYKNNSFINTTSFNRLKKAIYCSNSISCDLFTSIKLLFENNESKVLNYFIPDGKFISNLSFEEFNKLIKNSHFNLTYCDYNNTKNVKFVENRNKVEINNSLDQYYLFILYIPDVEKREVYRAYTKICDLYDLNVLFYDDSYDLETKPLKINPDLSLMKINVRDITPEIAVDAVFYYDNSNKFRPGLDYLDYRVFDVGSNYIIHIFDTTPSYYSDDGSCYENIFYRVYKINKKNKVLSRLNEGSLNVNLGECIRNLTYEEIEETKEIRELYYREVNKSKVDFKKIVENRKSTLSNKFIEWINRTIEQNDFSHPVVQRVLRKEANGTFEVFIIYNLNISQDQIKDELGRFGDISDIRCFLDDCSLSMKLRDIFIINNFINYEYIRTIYLESIYSDYSPPNPLIVNFCEKDEDCVPAGGCHPTSTINKEFTSYQHKIACTAVCSGPLDCGAGKPICINNKCGIKKGSLYY